MIKPNTLEEKIVKLALLQHHKEYVYGSKGPDTFDCASFVKYVYKEILGINIYEGGYGKSTTTKIMTSKYGELTTYVEDSKFKDLTLIKEGDILFFHRQEPEATEPKVDNKYPGHCGIYIGDNRFIHASGRAKKIIISNFNKEYWVKKLVGFKHII